MFNFVVDLYVVMLFGVMMCVFYCDLCGSGWVVGVLL